MKKQLWLALTGALLGLGAAFSAQARTIVNVEPYVGYVCTITYSDGSREVDYCPTDWPPASQPIAVGCQCEHFGSPYDDVCEVTTAPFILQPTYSWSTRGPARFTQPPSSSSEFAFFSCPRGTPPGYNCTIQVQVTAPSGASGSALCYSN